MYYTMIMEAAQYMYGLANALTHAHTRILVRLIESNKL